MKNEHVYKATIELHTSRVLTTYQRQLVAAAITRAIDESSELPALKVTDSFSAVIEFVETVEA